MLNARRRGLMRNADDTIALKDVPIGALFSFSDGGYGFIYCGIIYGNAQVLRESVYSITKKMRNSETGTADYDGSNVDVYLSETVYNQFGDDAKAAMVDSDIPYSAWNGSSVSNKTISRKIYIPPEPLLGGNREIINALKSYAHTSSGNTARIAKDTGGTARAWWTMTAYSGAASQMVSVVESGAVSASKVSYQLYIRPVISLKKDTKVQLKNGVYVLA